MLVKNLNQNFWKDLEIDLHKNKNIAGGHEPEIHFRPDEKIIA